MSDEPRYMEVFQVKMREGGMDGWGKDLPVTISVLGTFSKREEAEQQIKRIKSTKGRMDFAVGQPWIETLSVKIPDNAP